MVEVTTCPGYPDNGKLKSAKRSDGAEHIGQHRWEYDEMGICRGKTKAVVVVGQYDTLRTPCTIFTTPALSLGDDGQKRNEWTNHVKRIGAQKHVGIKNVLHILLHKSLKLNLLFYTIKFTKINFIQLVFVFGLRI